MDRRQFIKLACGTVALATPAAASPSRPMDRWLEGGDGPPREITVADLDRWIEDGGSRDLKAKLTAMGTGKSSI